MLNEVRDWIEELACRAGLDGLPASGRLAGIVAGVVVAGVLAWMLWGATPSQGVAGPAAPSGETASTASREASAAQGATPATLTVHVVGEVRRPGVYELPAGARARDAVEAAGGLLGDAEASAINLARPVKDGEQIAVPRQGETPAVAGSIGPGGGGAPGGKVNLNTASAAQLDALPGIGPSTAAKIVSDRETNGPFKSVDDLMRVSGIGPAKFDGLKDLVSAD